MTTTHNTRTRAAAAAVCAVAAATGLIGAAAPAVAVGSATAVYNCSYVDPVTHNTVTIPGVSTTWSHTTSNVLTIKSNVASPATLPPGALSATVNGVTMTNSTSELVRLGPAVVLGVVLPSNPLILQYTPTSTTITCVLVSSSGFPI